MEMLHNNDAVGVASKFSDSSGRTDAASVQKLRLGRRSTLNGILLALATSLLFLAPEMLLGAVRADDLSTA